MQDTGREEGTSSCDVLLWTSSYGRAKAGRPARTYIQQFCDDRGYSSEDRLEAMDIREGGERGSAISVLIAQHDDDNDDFTYHARGLGKDFVFFSSFSIWSFYSFSLLLWI